MTTIAGWVVFGLIAGFVASRIAGSPGEGFLTDVVVGVIGSIVGGWLFAQFGWGGVSGFNIYSMFVAVIGAIVVLWVYHLIAGRRSAL